MMRWCTYFAIGVLTVACTRVTWADGKRVVVRVAGEVDGKWIERVIPFCRENTGLDIQTGDAVNGEFTSLNEVARAASDQLTAQDAFVIVLSGIRTDEQAHGICLNDIRAAIVNVPVLLGDNPDDERAGRRLERQVMQSIGSLLGMAACPNPQCVLWPYSNMEELDAKGRNLCPPCFDQLQKKANEQGLTLTRATWGEPVEEAAEQSGP